MLTLTKALAAALLLVAVAPAGAIDWQEVEEASRAAVTETDRQLAPREREFDSQILRTMTYAPAVYVIPECVILTSNPPQTQCTWRECSKDATGAEVCRHVTETSGSSCTSWKIRRECDSNGANCTEWRKP